MSPLDPPIPLGPYSADPPAPFGQPTSTAPSEGASPNAEAQGATAPIGAPKGKEDRHGFQARYDRLYREKQDAFRALDALQERNLSLETRLAAIEGQLQNRAPNGTSEPDEGPISPSWEKLTQGQLLEVIRTSTDQPEVMARAVDEISRRRAVAENQKLREEWQEHRDKEREIGLYMEMVKRDFGPDSQRKDSELTTQARRYASDFVNQYGKDILERQPMLIHHCYALADRDLKGQRLTSSEQELERLRAAEKVRLAQESALEAATPPEHTAAVKDLLSKGDKMGALRLHARRLLSSPSPDR